LHDEFKPENNLNHENCFNKNRVLVDARSGNQPDLPLLEFRLVQPGNEDG